MPAETMFSSLKNQIATAGHSYLTIGKRKNRTKKREEIVVKYEEEKKEI